MNTPKYHNKRVEHAGRSFASKGEASCYDYLCWLEKAGEVSDIRCQVTVQLLPHVRYKPDFVIFDKKISQDVYCEFKGLETEAWVVKRNIWRSVGPGWLRIYKSAPGGHVRLVLEIPPGSYGLINR